MTATTAGAAAGEAAALINRLLPQPPSFVLSQIHFI